MVAASKVLTVISVKSATGLGDPESPLSPSLREHRLILSETFEDRVRPIGYDPHHRCPDRKLAISLSIFRCAVTVSMLRFSRRALQFRSRLESVGNRRKTPKFCSIDGSSIGAGRKGRVRHSRLNVHSRARGLH